MSFESIIGAIIGAVVVAGVLLLLEMTPAPVACIEPINLKIIELDEIVFRSCSNRAQLHLWDFDDGHFSTRESPAHVFNKAGDYTVRLTVFSKRGKYTSTVLKIEVLSRVPDVD